MAAKPTLGPWKVSNWTSIKPNPGKRGISILGAEGIELAKIGATMDDSESANAALISAAPDLLGALMAVQRVDDWRLVQDQVEQAIAKAEGR